MESSGKQVSGLCYHIRKKNNPRLTNCRENTQFYPFSFASSKSFPTKNATQNTTAVSLRSLFWLLIDSKPSFFLTQKHIQSRIWPQSALNITVSDRPASWSRGTGGIQCSMSSAFRLLDDAGPYIKWWVDETRIAVAWGRCLPALCWHSKMVSWLSECVIIECVSRSANDL